MALYPSLNTIKGNVFSGSSQQKVSISNFNNLGVEQRKLNWQYPVRTLEITYNNRSESELQTLLNFEINQDGEYQLFTFIYPSWKSNTYSNEFVGVGDGSTVAYNLPSLNSTSRTVTVGGNTQTEADDATSSGDFYIVEGDGVDGVDLLTFFDPPNTGEIIKFTFTGRLAIRCRFDGKIRYNTSRVIGNVVYNNISVKLQGRLINE